MARSCGRFGGDARDGDARDGEWTFIERWGDDGAVRVDAGGRNGGDGGRRDASKDAAAEFDRTMDFVGKTISTLRELDAQTASWRTVGGVLAWVRRAAAC